MDVSIPGPLAHFASGPEMASNPQEVKYMLLVLTRAKMLTAAEIAHR